jgi:hypothetical protein
LLTYLKIKKLNATKSKWSNFKEVIHIDNHQVKDYYLPMIIFVLFTTASFLFFKIFAGQYIWHKMKIAGGNAFEFCEFNDLGNVLVQTSNTWSNLGFLVVGLLLIFFGIKDHRHQHEDDRANLLLKYPFFSIIMGSSILYLFIGSFFYHASVTSFFQMLDQTGMYAIVFSFMAYHIFRAWPTLKTKNKGVVSSHKIIFIVFLILNVLFVSYLWKVVDVNVFFPILFVTYITVTVIYNKRNSIVKASSKLLLFSLYMLFFSLTIWLLDREDVLCDPTSLIQGHALWHILNSVVLLMIYLHYRAERSFLPAEANNS